MPSILEFKEASLLFSFCSLVCSLNTSISSFTQSFFSLSLSRTSSDKSNLCLFEVAPEPKELTKLLYSTPSC